MTLAAVVLLLSAACNRPVPQPAKKAAGPQVIGTVVTIETTTQPSRRTFAHTLVIAGDRARSSDELDRWRLFDIKTGNVTFIDGIAKTYRLESPAGLVAARAEAMNGALAAGMPHVEFIRGTEIRTILGVPATSSIVKSGRYRRELWIGNPPAIPPTLFSMMEASDVPHSRLAPVMKSADVALLAIRGFPLADHAELPFLNQKLVVDRTVTRIESKGVPQSFLEVPAGFTESPALYGQRSGLARARQ